MEHHFTDCTLDDARLTLTRDGSRVAVEPKVFDLIHLLVRNAGDLVTRDRMVDEVWGGRIVSESAMSACIAAARERYRERQKRARSCPRSPRQVANKRRSCPVGGWDFKALERAGHPSLHPPVSAFHDDKPAEMCKRSENVSSSRSTVADCR
jgi:hypothetical protein